jgi:hypothetical protein
MASISCATFQDVLAQYEVGEEEAAWSKWTAQLKIFFGAAGIEANARKKALLLHLEGDKVQDAFTPPDQGVDETCDALIERLTPKFKKATNEKLNKYKLRNTSQRQGESISDYADRLRKLAKCSGLANDAIDSKIVDAMTQGCTSVSLKRYLLHHADAKLDEAIKEGLIIESVENHLNEKLTKPSGGELINRIEHNETETNQARCGRCGRSHPSQACPAYGLECKRCGRRNHFAKFCKTKKPQDEHRLNFKLPTNIPNSNNINFLKIDCIDSIYLIFI